MKLILLLQLIATNILSLIANEDYKFLNSKPVNYAFLNGNEIQIETSDQNKNWIAKATWEGESYNTTGWSTLEIESNERMDDHQQAYAAGFLEGKLTKELISLHLLNTVGDFCKQKSGSCSKLIEFIQKNLKWLKYKIENNHDDPYWYHVHLTFCQFHGLYNGFIGNKFYGKENILDLMLNNIEPYLTLIALQLNGDLSELQASFDQVSDPFMAGSCSALIKLIGNNEELFVSHDTWTEYESMLRILKLYKLNYHMTAKEPVVVPGSEISFSSYPGILLSIDDFYVINSRLVVTETTIGNSNSELWKFVNEETVLYFIRVMVANRLAYSGSDWSKLFSKHNSGTYNNEWMIIDYKMFYPGKPLQDGLLTVLEQIPGLIHWEDKTDTLRYESYWPSYNIAYFKNIYNMSGTYDAFIKYGDFFSYNHSPRSNIFRRDHSKVKDIESMIALMRYNDYTNDPFSKCDCSPPYSAENTIAARSDLNPISGTYPFDSLGHRDHGATDMKLTSFEISKSLSFISIAGPTYNDKNIKPFIWSEADFGNSTNHFGHTDKWTFKPFYVKWNL